MEAKSEDEKVDFGELAEQCTCSKTRKDSYYAESR